MLDRLVNTEIVIENFAGTSGFDKLITDLKNGNNSVQEGIRFAVSRLSTIDPATVAQLDHKFPNPCNQCRFDVRITSVNYLEFKSVADEGGITRNQLRTYISNVNNFGQLDYVFDAAKTSLTEAKSFMRTVMRSDSYVVFENMNSNLRATLGINPADPEDVQEAVFRAMVENLDSALYNFVNVR